VLATARTASMVEKLECYTRAIELDPNCAEAYADRGDLYYAKGNYAAAIYDFGKLIKLQPLSAETYFARGQAYSKQGDIEDALQDFTSAIKLKPDYAEAYQNRAMLYSEQHAYTEAMADVQKALQLGAQVDPDFVSALTRVLKSQPPAAPGEAKKTAAAPANLSPAEEALAKGMAEKKPADQFYWFNRAVKLDPKNANALVYRGDAYCQQGDAYC
jgi:tetratricopeptide (TPR) repeat protein